MINTLKLYFQNLPFRKKITSICLLISLIPVILMGVLAYLQIRSQMIDREETALFETLRQETDVISNRLSDYNLILNTILWDEAIKTGLLQDYPTNYDLYLFYKQSIDPLFLTLRSLNKDLTAVTLYTDGPAYPHGSYINTLDSAKEMPWYEQALTSTVPFYEVSSDYKTLYLVCQMYYPYPAPVTIVCLAIDMNI